MKIKANGIQMNYQLSGKENEPVVVLSHSLGSSLAMWDPQMEILEARYKVLRYDIRGHGGSDAPEGAYTPWINWGTMPSACWTRWELMWCTG